MNWLAKKSQVTLFTALGIDNFGSGLFLPLTVVYVTRVAGLALCTAGIVVSLGTLAGLAMPPAVRSFLTGYIKAANK